MRSQVLLTEAHVPPDKRIAPLMGPLSEVLADLRTFRELGVGHIGLWPAAREPDLDTYLGHMEWIARDIVAPLAADR
jgi:hypothetical protein